MIIYISLTRKILCQSDDDLLGKHLVLERLIALLLVLVTYNPFGPSAVRAISRLKLGTHYQWAQYSSL
jgi:hypothetical protein